MPEAVKAFASIFSLLIGFVLVLAAAYWATRMIGKRYELGAQGSGSIKILDRVAVGQDRIICIVQAADKTLLVGVTGQRMDTLAELDPSTLPSPPPREAAPNFSDTLKNLMGQRNAGAGEKEAD